MFDPHYKHYLPSLVMVLVFTLGNIPYMVSLISDLRRAKRLSWDHYLTSTCEGIDTSMPQGVYSVSIRRRECRKRDLARTFNTLGHTGVRSTVWTFGSRQSYPLGLGSISKNHRTLYCFHVCATFWQHGRAVGGHAGRRDDHCYCGTGSVLSTLGSKL